MFTEGQVKTEEIAKIPRSVGTHDGTFHADEVTACALLLLFDLVDGNKIIRTRQLGTLEKSSLKPSL